MKSANRGLLVGAFFIVMSVDNVQPMLQRLGRALRVAATRVQNGERFKTTVASNAGNGELLGRFAQAVKDYEATTFEEKMIIAKRLLIAVETERTGIRVSNVSFADARAGELVRQLNELQQRSSAPCVWRRNTVSHTRADDSQEEEQRRLDDESRETAKKILSGQ